MVPSLSVQAARTDATTVAKRDVCHGKDPHFSVSSAHQPPGTPLKELKAIPSRKQLWGDPNLLSVIPSLESQYSKLAQLL